jgi:zinc transport system ATP-binding protein
VQLTSPDRAGWPEPIIEMRDISIGYGDRPAVRGIDFRLGRGEVTALVGPNGSGKTTLVRGVLGLARVMTGEVELFGTPARDFRERWRIGYVPQRHTVVGAVPCTVAEVVSSGRLPRKRLWAFPNRADRAAVDAAIDTVGLTERRSAPVATLSGGQQRRVLIARALATQPDVLVMDEPTAGVDAESQDRLVLTLEQLVHRGLTLLVVTHDIAPLRAVLTRVVLLRDGRIVRDEPTGTDGALSGVLDSELDAGHDPQHSAPGPDGRPADPVRSPIPGWLGDPGLGG